MIKKLLEGMRDKLQELNPAPKLDPSIPFKMATDVLDEIQRDITHLESQDPTFLDGPQGFIDYYSPYAEAQIRNKQELLEKYIDDLALIQATLICIQQKKMQRRDLLQNKESLADADVELKLGTIKSEMIDLMNSNRDQLSSREDVKAVLQTEEYRQELKILEGELKKTGRTENETPEELRRKDELNALIKRFDDSMISPTDDDIKQTAFINRDKDRFRFELNKHIKLTSQMPRGMLDVKRALNFQRELPDIKNKIKTLSDELTALISAGSDEHEIQKIRKKLEDIERKEKEISSITYSESPEVDGKIKKMLEDLRWVMLSSIKGYQKIAISGGDIDDLLHQTTAFYWRNNYLYRKILLEINEYIDTKASHLTEEGRLVAECMNNALEHVMDEKSINDGLRAVRAVDKDRNLRENKYAEETGESEHETQIGFYSSSASDLLHTLRDIPGEFFYIPYNSHSYALDHPAGTDLAGALGNCYGETQMFLQRINQKKPTFNNICPQTDLINYQLDQSRTVGRFDIPRGIPIKSDDFSLIRMLNDPTTMDKFELGKLLSGNKSYVLVDSIVYYIDASLNIEKLSEIDEKLQSRFPVDYNRTIDARPGVLKGLKNQTGHVQENSSITWGAIKRTLTEKVKKGDICTIKLSGGKLGDRDEEVGHVIGFVRMKDNKPFKYIVYDYGFGAVGFSNEEQLEIYFNTLLSSYIPFTQCAVNKIEEVSDGCEYFFNGGGEDSVKPLLKTKQDSTLELTEDTADKRHYWNKKRLTLLMEYNNGSSDHEMKLALTKISLLKSPEEKSEVYNAIFENKSIDLKKLLIDSIEKISEANPELVAEILKKINLGEYPDFKAALKGQHLKILASWVSEGKISADLASEAFKTDQNIVLAAYKKDRKSLGFADVRTVMALVATKKIDHEDAFALNLKFSDKSQIIKHIKDSELQPITAASVFYFDEAIINAAIEKTPKPAEKEKLVKQVCDALVAKINSLSESNKQMPALNPKLKLNELLSTLPDLMQALEIKNQALATRRQQEAEEKAAQLADEADVTDVESISSDNEDGVVAELPSILDQEKEALAIVKEKLGSIRDLSDAIRYLSVNLIDKKWIESADEILRSSQYSMDSGLLDENIRKLEGAKKTLDDTIRNIDMVEKDISNLETSILAISDTPESLDKKIKLYSEIQRKYESLRTIIDVTGPLTNINERMNQAIALQETRAKIDEIDGQISALTKPSVDLSDAESRAAQLAQQITWYFKKTQLYASLNKLTDTTTSLNSLHAEMKHDMGLASDVNEVDVSTLLSLLDSKPDCLAQYARLMALKRPIDLAEFISMSQDEYIAHLGEYVTLLSMGDTYAPHDFHSLLVDGKLDEAERFYAYAIKNYSDMLIRMKGDCSEIVHEIDAISSNLDSNDKIKSNETKEKIFKSNNRIECFHLITELNSEKTRLIELASKNKNQKELDSIRVLHDDIRLLSASVRDKSAFESAVYILRVSSSINDVKLLDRYVNELQIKKSALVGMNAEIKKLNERIIELVEPDVDLNDARHRADQLGEKIQWYLDKKTIYESLNPLTDVTEPLNEFRAAMQSYMCPVSCKNDQESRQFDEFILLLSNNSEYRKSYVGLIESPHKMDLGVLMKAHHQFGEKVVINAMDLTVKHGWDQAEIYLSLKENNQNATADAYCNGLMVHSTDYINDQRKNCLNYIEKISKAQFGTKDIKSNAYCESMKKYIESSQFDSISNSDAILQELQTIHTAVTSPGMKAVQKQVARLEESARGMISIGNQNKADKIRSAVCNVPLAERLHMLEPGNVACKPVGIALATHRKSFTNPLDINGDVIETKAADSYKNAMKELRNPSNGPDSTHSSSLNK